MRNLIIMRHAKAERGKGKRDFDRTLEDRGWRDADVVAAKLAAEGLVPDIVLCSAARRTRDTFAAVLPHFDTDLRAHFLESIYDAAAEDLLGLVRAAEGQRLLLIGHNPTMHELALHLAGEDAQRVGSGFPTSTAAVFSMGLAMETARLDGLVKPA